jgi:ribonuclease HI
MTYDSLILNTDGASRGNPGPASIGVVIQNEAGKTVDSISECLPACTNNQAEYQAIIAGLERALKLGAKKVLLRSDSELVVQQLCGKYRVKNEGLLPLFQRVMGLRQKFTVFQAVYVPREKNREADKMCNLALDGKKAEVPQPAQVLETKKIREPFVGGIKVRKADRADYAAIIEIIEELEKQHVDAVPEMFSTMSYDEQVADLDSILADGKLAFLVAERGGTILGFVHLALYDEPARGGVRARKYVKVRDLAVAKRYQRSGAGSALMQAAEHLAKEQNAVMLELLVWEFNRGAFAFYQKIGYTTASRVMWKHI